MSSPVRRRQSAAVYRRRRIVVFGGLLVVIAGLVTLLIVQPWRGSGSPTTPATNAPTHTAAATTQPTAPVGTPTPAPSGGTQACNDTQVIVTPITDKTAYAAGENPKLSLSIANSSPADCTLDVGTATQVFTVSSGSDVWWRSTDCQSNPASQLITLKAGQKIDSSEGGIVWDRTRSSTETCGEAERPAAPGGGATYRLSVSIAGIASAETATFTLE